jgi:electron transport complex protein RnfE
MASYSEIIKNGLWTSNPGLVQLLGLCPLLAVSNTTVNALGMAMATMMVLVTTNIIISMIRNAVRPEIRIPVFVLVIAAAVTLIELIMNAMFHELYTVLGIFIPLIVTNCAIIGRAEAFAAKNPVGHAALDGLMMGLGFGLVLFVLGAMREVLGQGTLFAQADLMFGPAAGVLTVTVFEDYPGFLLAMLPPGAFIGLGLLIALKNVIDNRYASKQPKVTEQAASQAA